MNWNAIGAVGEIVGSLAVLITLVYLAIQVRHVRRQTMLASYQHTIDASNQFADQITSSESLADIITRGRDSYASLTPPEQLRFDHIYGRLINSIESWHLQLLETADAGPYRDEQLRNIGVVIRKYCDFPGVAEFWRDWQLLYSAETRKLIEDNVGGV
jgi:hypothetical protein